MPATSTTTSVHGFATEPRSIAGFAQPIIERAAVVEAGEVVRACFAFEPANHRVAAPECLALGDGVEDARGELSAILQILFAEEIVGTELERRKTLRVRSRRS